MPGTPLDVILEPRLGPRKSARRQRVTIGSVVPVFFDIRDDQTGALVPGATGVSALYWLPDPAEGESAFQPLDATEITAGTWQVLVPTSRPGSYVAWLSIQGPIAQTAELTFDVTSVGGLSLTSTGTVPWGEVQASGAAAGASAGLAAGRSAGAAAGSTAGVAAAKPFADSAAASEGIALDAADMSREERIAAQAAKDAAVGARDTSVTAAADASAKAQTAAERASAADAAANTASTAASAAVAGANIYPDTATGLAAVAEGATFNVAGAGATYATTYRKVAGAAVPVQSYPSKAALDAVPVLSEPGFTERALAVVDTLGNIAMGLSGDAKTLELVFALLRGMTDGTVRLERRDGTQGIEVRADGVALPGLMSSTSTQGNGGVAFADADGFVIGEGRPDGDWLLSGWRLVRSGSKARLFGPDGTEVIASLVGGGATLAGMDVLQTAHPDFSFAVADAAGYIGFGIAPNATAKGTGLGGTTATVTPAEVAALDSEAAAYSSRVRRRYVGDLHQPVEGIVLWIVYGQSLSAGLEGWPALSKLARFDNLMMGQSVHSLTDGTTWTPIGGSAAFQSLISTVRNSGVGVMADAEVAQLAFGAGNAGETSLEGFLAQFRQAWLRARGKIGGDPANRFVAVSCGVGSKTVAELSQGADPEVFNRIRQAITLAKAQADAAGLSFSVGGILYNQGENDYSATTYDAYASGLAQLFSDVRACVGGQTGQAGILPIYMVQTGGQYARDPLELQVARAQIQVAATVPGVFLCGGNAPQPDKGGHLTSNGYRWLGNQAGKVAARTLIEGQGWEATRMIRAVVRDRTLVGLFHAPVGPLRFADPISGQAVQALPSNGGLYVADGAGEVPVVSCRLAGKQIVEWTLGRATSGTVRVWLGRQAGSQGLTWIADSDDTHLVDRYEYNAGSGQTADENIPDLVGLTYSAANFALADVQTAIAI